MEQIKELQGTYLVQRLEKAVNYANPFSLGGGYKNGWLTGEGMKMLSGLFSFAYMGAAEYEFGAVATFFHELAKNIKEYRRWELNINGTPIYVIGQDGLIESINDRLIAISKHKSGYIKCGCNLDSAVGLSKYSPKEKCKTIGWLELDNIFAFFTDKKVTDDLFILFNTGTLNP